MWGQKATFHVYVEGELSESLNGVDDVVETLEKVYGSKLNFVGVTWEEIEEEPKDQVGT